MALKRFRKILVHTRAGAPYNACLARAERLALEYGASLHLVDVMDEVPAYVQLLMPANWGLPETICQYKQEHLEQVAAGLREKGVRVTSAVLRGATPTALIQEVLRKRHDLLIRASEQDTAGAVGTIDMRLLRQCPCPVWLERPAKDKHKRQIVAAINVTATDRDEVNLNRNILRLSISVAENENAELHIVHAWRPYGEAMIGRGSLYVSHEDIMRYVEQVRSSADQAMRKLVAGSTVDGAEPTCHLVKGDAGEVIPEFVHQIQADLVVMGTVARSGAAGVLIGNTAERILNRLDCSLLALKPAGFISPVTLPKPW